MTESKKLNRPIQGGLHFVFIITFGLGFLSIVLASLASPDVIKNSVQYSDKLIHFCVYLVISFLALGAFPKQKLIFIFLGLSFAGIAIELLQASMGLGRTASIGDIAANCLGIAAPIFIWMIISARLKPTNHGPLESQND